MDDQRRDKDPVVESVRQQQHTGNHPIGRDAGGADRFGGTRKGAENVEPPPVGGRRPTDPDEIEASDMSERDKQYGGDDN